MHLFRIFFATSLAAGVALSGCNSSQSRAAKAYAEYQLAAANNDSAAARTALFAVVAADEDNSEAWVALGRVQLSLGDYGGAYNAFVRARELDRTNADLLRVLTQIALTSGNLALANDHASDLAILAPGDIWVQLTDGYAALARKQFSDSLMTANDLLESYPSDPAATVLKARSLLGIGQPAEAKATLENQLEVQPRDVESARLLAKMYWLDSDWPNVARVSQRIVEADPSIPALLLLAEAGFRSGKHQQGRSASLNILSREPQPRDVEAVLDLWREHWRSPQSKADAIDFGGKARREDVRLVFADFLTRVGRPREALSIVGPENLPITAANAEANAVIGNALIAGGQLSAGKKHLDAVLAFDPGNMTALRGRAELLLRTGSPKAAVDDAQKLVSTLPTSAEARILLARSFRSAGEVNRSDRVLWEAFHTIRADDALFRALLETSRRRGDDPSRLRREYAAQRLAEIQGGQL